jgi:hypothetical protein
VCASLSMMWLLSRSPSPKAGVYGGVRQLSGLPYFGSILFAFQPYEFLVRARSKFPSEWLSFDICGVSDDLFENAQFHLLRDGF